jgi:integrase/recombinase XerD
MVESFQIVRAELEPETGLARPAQRLDMSGARDDDQFVVLWLSRYSSPNTRRAYRFESDKFLRAIRARGKEIRNLTFLDATEVMADLTEGLSPCAAARRIDAIRSLYSLAMRLGYIPMNVMAAIERPKVPDGLAARILTKEQLYSMMAHADPETKFIIKLLYISGMRVSEAAALRWKDVVEREGGKVQLTVFGKGSKTRFVLLPASMGKMLAERRKGSSDFVIEIGRSSKIHTRARRIEERVSAAGESVGLEKNPSPHWMRHAHASHALDAGAKLHVLMETLGHSDARVTSHYLHVRPGESSSDYLGE